MVDFVYLAVTKVVDFGTFRLPKDVLAIEKEAFVQVRMGSIEKVTVVIATSNVLFQNSVEEDRIDKEVGHVVQNVI